MNWKSIEGYPTYLISDCGKVKNSKTGRILKTSVVGGYEQIKLNKKNMYVHRLVALHFVMKDSTRNEVNHIDGNKLNNHVSNIEWTTRSENMKHAFSKGLSHLSKMRSYYDECVID